METKKDIIEPNPTAPPVMAPAEDNMIPPPSYSQAYPGTAPAPIIIQPSPMDLGGQPMVNTVIAEPAAREMQCPHCNATERTILRRENGIRNHAFAAVLCVSCMCIPCMWIPYFIDALKDANHYCSVCGGLIGKQMTMYDQPGYRDRRGFNY